MPLSTPDGILQDLRYTLRTLRRDAGFTTFAVLIVGLGIGASATVFSVVDALCSVRSRSTTPRAWSGSPITTSAVSPAKPRRSTTCWTSATQSRSFYGIAGYMAFYGVGDNLLSTGASRSASAACPSRRISSNCWACNR